MGVSTNAILAFGFDLGSAEDDGLPSCFAREDGESFDFDEWLTDKAGAVYPEGHSGINSPEYTEYAAKRDAAIAGCPVDLITHCSYDYPMHFLALRGSQVTAHRGYPQAVAPTQPAPEQIAAMRAFCDEHGIAWKEPAWHIFSLWG